MAVPKRRKSKARARKGRTHWKASSPTLVRCAQCNTPKRAHYVCPECGYYAKRQAVAVAEES